MPPLPELIDDVTTEILLRVPPDEPKHLVRASLVCKRWFRLLTDPDFLRRYRAFHRLPSLLGYMHMLVEPRLIPTTAAPLALAPDPCFREGEALDCRHGRFLLRDVDRNLAVWDPISGGQQLVPEVDIDWLLCSATVFCAVRGCDHLDCYGGPFQVVFIATDRRDLHVKACVYSSETDEWSTPVSLGDNLEIYFQRRQDALKSYYGPGAVIGDEVYFMLFGEADAIVKYDLRKNCLSMIDPPTRRAYQLDLALMEMDDSSLGFAHIECSDLYLWSRKVNLEGAAEWVQFRVIESVTMMVPVASPNDQPYVVGAAESLGVIFVHSSAGLFTIRINSGKVTKIDGHAAYVSILPYLTFYTPDRGAIIANKAKDSTDLCASHLKDVSRRMNPSS